MTIRDVCESDLDRIEELERESFSIPWTREMLEYQLADEGHIFLACELDGALAGYVGLQHVLDEGYITNVCTASEFRRRGAARALIYEAIERGKALGLAFLTLEVRDSNLSAHALYSSMGFKELGRRRNYYEKPVEDAIIMTLLLK